jgi:hypothetical protein
MLPWLSKLSTERLIALSLIFTGGVNLLIFAFDINGASALKSMQTSSFFPSSKLIGTVWTLLIVILSYSFSSVSVKSPQIAKHILGLFFLCVLYPFYTLGFSSVILMFIGNTLTVAYSFFLALLLFTKFKKEASFVCLITLWVMYVTILMIDLHRFG